MRRVRETRDARLGILASRIREGRYSVSAAAVAEIMLEQALNTARAWK